jgi:hypothetical protein
MISAAAVKYPTDGYHRIEFEEDPREIYPDAAQMERTYSLPAMQHL